MQNIASALSPCATIPPSDGQAEHSRFFQRLHRRYGQDLALLPPGAPTRATMEEAMAALRARGVDMASALRTVRQLVMERLIRLDCEARAPLGDITRAVTELAELALDHACRHAREELDSRHGAPLGPQGQPVQLWIIGMGKLGARELNVSSDIDLIYVYEHDGDTAGIEGGRGRISNHEYFARAVKAIYSLVGDTTEHGFVFRVDLALRPNGNSGPAAISLSALEEYLQVQGREWERFAWLKSRVVAPTSCIGSPEVQALRGVVLPFVFRRYLDYSVFDALRSLHRQIRDHAAKRSAGHPERANDVKLSRGGIREIEFTVQLLQVVRGGQFPELRRRPTLEALQRLAQAGLMPQETADAMARAYVFLRHQLAVGIQLVQKGAAVGVAHGAGNPGQIVVARGQHMGLLVVQVLDAVLHLAQKDVGAGHGVGRLLRHQPGLGQALQGLQRGAAAQLGELPSAHHLQQLHGEFDFADATARQLHVVGALGMPCTALGCMIANLAVQAAQRIEHVVVEVTPKNKRQHHAAQRLHGRAGNAAGRGYHAALEPGKTLPFAALHLQVFLQCCQRQCGWTGVAVGSQRQINAKHKAMLCGFTDQAVD